MKVFMDTEFTGLHQNTTLISLGIVAEDGKMFYAEFNDYDKSQINFWLQQNVIDKLWVSQGWKRQRMNEIITNVTYIHGNNRQVRDALETWLKQFDGEIIVWSDCLAYDWVLFCEIWICDFEFTKKISYIPFDICTAFEMKGIDPDIGREEFAGLSEDSTAGKHNALWDAKVIKACYEKLMEINEDEHC